MTSHAAAGRSRPITLDEESLTRGLRYLARRDGELAAIYERWGVPPLWPRAEGFASLVHIILEQQVSLASALAAFGRLEAASSPLTPERFLEFGDEELRAIGFSRQKTGYVRSLARAIIAGELDLAALRAMDDEGARAELVRMKGVGAWTAEIYLLRALMRADAWPAGDLALAVALQEVKRLPARPTPLEVERAAEGWRPWRAVAACLLWNHYLNRPAAGGSKAGKASDAPAGQTAGPPSSHQP